MYCSGGPVRGRGLQAARPSAERPALGSAGLRVPAYPPRGGLSGCGRRGLRGVAALGGSRGGRAPRWPRRTPVTGDGLWRSGPGLRGAASGLGLGGGLTRFAQNTSLRLEDRRGGSVAARKRRGRTRGGWRQRALRHLAGHRRRRARWCSGSRQVRGNRSRRGRGTAPRPTEPILGRQGVKDKGLRPATRP